LLFRFLNDMIWQYGAVEAISAVAESENHLDRFTAGVLDHPAFAGWFWQAPALYDAAAKLGVKHTLSARSAAVTQLAGEAFGTAMTSYCRHCWRMRIGSGAGRARPQPVTSRCKLRRRRQRPVGSPRPSVD
jgi:hypothetical protein